MSKELWDRSGRYALYTKHTKKQKKTENVFRNTTKDHRTHTHTHTRWDAYGAEMFRLKDRKGTEYCLG
jgi:prolyl-tRNA synthetase